MEMWKYFIDADQRAVQSWNLMPKGGDTKMGDYPLPFLTPIPLTQAWDYLIDADQRTILFLDVLRERGNQYLKQISKTAPHVLDYEFELIMDGRSLKRPVNYGLIRIQPPAGKKVDPKNRPVVVIDPRAGHGPGIGGFKAQSEIGMAIEAGYPTYFIGFVPEPVPGQTIEDIAKAEAQFLEKVIGLHPEADGKPFVIGNCQAGWAVMLVAAERPELFGPILLAGSPLSYWAGVHGKNPMRYTGGLLGGSWLTALTSDLGHGKFDGSYLVANFENLNPANTLWTKQYNVWAKVDTEAPRYLGFEKWWNVHSLLNGEEIQYIVDNLFVGNKLATAEIVTSDGKRLDLRKIKSPIICFCSRGDDITPPPQALDWILDLYKDVDDIRAHGQTIVYCIHESIGHLGIFVSGKVATKEHQEFAHNIDMIDCLPPGLYQAVIRPKTKQDANVELGDFIVRFEARTLDDIRALGCNSATDERKFATVARLSEINLGLYRTFVQPWVKMMVNEQTAEWLHKTHPLRLQYELFSNMNPFMRPIAQLAEQVRAQRRPASPDNPFLALQEQVSQLIITALDAYRDLRDQTYEAIFHAIYGAPQVQALLGLKASDEPPHRWPGLEPEECVFIERRIAELKARIPEGGLREAGIRAMLYIGLKDAFADGRDFAVIRRLRKEHGGLPLSEFKQKLREQFFMLLLDEENAVRAIPAMLPEDREQREQVYAMVQEIMLAAGEPSEERRRRLDRVAELFGVGAAELVAERRGKKVYAVKEVKS
jgi:pimeloyl-ACP methyl ester carboxylesterase